jgi:hypothetical protein
MQAIIQLSTINGPIFHDESMAKFKYLENFIQYFIKCFSRLDEFKYRFYQDSLMITNNTIKNIFFSAFSNFLITNEFIDFQMIKIFFFFLNSSIQEYEILNIACLIENLMITFNLNDYEQLDDGMIEVFFNLMTQLTVKCFDAESIQDKSENTKRYFESYEKILLSWSRIKELKGGLVFKKYAKTIINAFIQSRLSDVDNLKTLLLDTTSDQKILNIRANRSSNNFDSESIDDAIAEDDFHYYKDVLITLSEFASFIPEYCVPLLSK